jgi:5,10-methylenetetrahydromethanopterin reductase
MTGAQTCEFSIRFPPSQTAGKTAQSARDAEAAGFDTIWMVDTPLIAGELFDPYVDLTVCALNTERVSLGPAVSAFALRHPVATGAAILGLDRIAPGRIKLGLGIGGSALTTLGQRSAHLGSLAHATDERRQELRDGMVFLKRLFAGEAVNLGSRDIQLASSRHIPVIMSATGPKALELAGEVADGVIIQVGIDRQTMLDAIERVHRGAERAGRDPDDVQIICSTFGVVSDNRQDDIDRVRPIASFFYSVTPKNLEKAGISTAKRYPDWVPHPDMTHAYDWEEAMAAAKTYIPDEVVERFCLVGPSEAARERITELIDIGVDEIFLRWCSTYDIPDPLIATFGSDIIPYFRDQARVS